MNILVVYSIKIHNKPDKEDQFSSQKWMSEKQFKNFSENSINSFLGAF